MSQPPVIEARGLAKTFRSGLVMRHRTQAVQEVSFEIMPGQTLAVVGESGCGKSTLARLAAGLLEPDKGDVRFMGRSLSSWPRKGLRQQLQVVFQDADGSLNPVLTARELLLEPLRLHGWSRTQAEERLPSLLDVVGLTPDLLSRHPHEMSGGQRQRICLARAMSLRPRLIIADEPVASLDRSVQALILSLLKKSQEREELSYLYISHDLATVRVMADHVAVMLGGVFVETGPVQQVLQHPAHPYTHLLLAAAGIGEHEPEGVVEGENETSIRSGCPFAATCPLASPTCQNDLPDLIAIQPKRTIRCHKVC
ncbi:MAG: oligopeptide/dipeptide ABC transporter ATP-binding protein [Desulfovibrionales bacterium]